MHAEALLRKFGFTNGLFLCRRKSATAHVLSMVSRGRYVHYIIGIGPTYTFDGTTSIFPEANSLDSMIQAMRVDRAKWTTPLVAPVTVDMATTGIDQNGLVKWNLQGDVLMHDTYMTVLTESAVDRAQSRQQAHSYAPQRSVSLGSARTEMPRSTCERQDHLRTLLQEEEDLYDFTRDEKSSMGLLNEIAPQPVAPNQLVQHVGQPKGRGISRSRRSTSGSFVQKNMHQARLEFERSKTNRNAGVRPSAVDHVHAVQNKRYGGSPRRSQSMSLGSRAHQDQNRLFEIAHSAQPAAGGGSLDLLSRNVTGRAVTAKAGNAIYAKPQRSLVPTAKPMTPNCTATPPSLPIRTASLKMSRKPIEPNYISSPKLPERSESLTMPSATSGPTYMHTIPERNGLVDQGAAPAVPMGSHPSRKTAEKALPDMNALEISSDKNPNTDKKNDFNAKERSVKRKNRKSGIFASLKRGGKKKAPAASNKKEDGKSFSAIWFLGAVPVDDFAGEDTCTRAIEQARKSNSQVVGGELALYPTHASVCNEENLEIHYVPVRAITYGYTCPDDEAVFAMIFEATPQRYQCLVMEATSTTGSSLLKRLEVALATSILPMEYDGPDAMKVNSAANLDSVA